MRIRPAEAGDATVIAAILLPTIRGAIAVDRATTEADPFASSLAPDTRAAA